MASKIKVDQILGSTGDEITVPTGQTLTVTDGIPVASGGTGIASFTAGDILYATGATTLTKLGKGTAEQVLAMNTGATAPDWGSVDLTVLPTITVAKGGTNLSSFTAGDIMYATGATTLAKLAKGTTLQTLKMNAGATAPEWATVAAASSDFVRLGNASWSGLTIIPLGVALGTDYRVYKLYTDVEGSYGSSPWELTMEFETGGDTWQTGADYTYTINGGYSGSTTPTVVNSINANNIRFTKDGLDEDKKMAFEITLTNLVETGAGDNAQVIWIGGGPNHDSYPNQHSNQGAGFWNSDVAITDIRLIITSGNCSGNWTLYGLKKS